MLRKLLSKVSRPRWSVEVFRDSESLYRWRARAANGEITAQSESYTRHADAYRAAESLCAARLTLDHNTIAESRSDPRRGP